MCVLGRRHTQYLLIGRQCELLSSKCSGNTVHASEEINQISHNLNWKRGKRRKWTTSTVTRSNRDHAEQVPRKPAIWAHGSEAQVQAIAPGWAPMRQALLKLSWCFSALLSFLIMNIKVLLYFWSNYRVTVCGFHNHQFLETSKCAKPKNGAGWLKQTCNKVQAMSGLSNRGGKRFSLKFGVPAEWLTACNAKGYEPRLKLWQWSWFIVK